MTGQFTGVRIFFSLGDYSATWIAYFAIGLVTVQPLPSSTIVPPRAVSEASGSSCFTHPARSKDQGWSVQPITIWLSYVLVLFFTYYKDRTACECRNDEWYEFEGEIVDRVWEEKWYEIMKWKLVLFQCARSDLIMPVKLGEFWWSTTRVHDGLYTRGKVKASRGWWVWVAGNNGRVTVTRGATASRRCEWKNEEKRQRDTKINDGIKRWKGRIMKRVKECVRPHRMWKVNLFTSVIAWRAGVRWYSSWFGAYRNRSPYNTQSLLVTRVIHVHPLILRLNTCFYSFRRVMFR